MKFIIFIICGIYFSIGEIKAINQYFTVIALYTMLHTHQKERFNCILY